MLETTAPTHRRSSRTGKPRLLAGVAAFVLVAATFSAFPSAAGANTTPVPVGGGTTGRKLVFQDEFNSTALSSTWSSCYYWRSSGCTNEWNNELEVYLRENVSVANGQLRMTAKRQTATGYLQNGTPKTFNYTSGMVSSEGKFSMLYGYLEFRAKVVKGRGLWPALWLMSSNRTWPPEIDVMEYIGSTPDRVHMTNHPKDASPAQSFTHVGPDFSLDWHTYAIDWRPGSLTFIVDGVPRGTITSGVPSERMYLLANLAVGGNWPGSPDSSTPFPSTFAVDYVRVWSDISGSTTPPPAPPKSATLTDDFNDGVVNTTKWTPSGSVRESSGRAVVPAEPSYPSLTSKQQYDLTGSHVLAEVPAVAGGVTSETYMTLTTSEGNSVAIIKSGLNLLFRSEVAGRVENPGAVVYNASVHRWWRIREAAGRVYWETSADGITWVTRRSASLGVKLSSVSVKLRAGYWGLEIAPTPAQFDNLNLRRA